MSPVRKNIIANLLGSGWVAVLSLAFIPLYIHFMGIEAYGLVGFYVTLQVLFSLLDMGLTTTVSRELARLSGLGDREQEMRNVVRTLELVYWCLALVVVLVVITSAEWISTSWLNSGSLSPHMIEQSVLLMGVVIAFRMPYGFYAGALIGLQKQVLLNVIKVCVETVRNGGGVLVLWLVSPTITAFFLWHAVTGLLAAILMLVMAWKNLPASKNRAAFTPSIFRYLWRFVAGMSGISVLSLILLETDKVILSKMLTLDEFGYYVLASTLAMGLNLLIVPLFSAMQPRFTQLVAQQDDASLKHTYHKSCQFMTVLVIPLALVLCFFSEEILHIWTQDSVVSGFAAPILSILVIGTACNALMNIPYALQLAYAWTKISIIADTIAILVLIPALLVMVSKYGSLGAASIWVALNIGYVLFLSPVIHARLLKGEFKHWVVNDFGIPTLAALIVVTILWAIMPAGLSMIGQLMWIGLSFLTAVSLCALSAPMVREMLWRTVVSYRGSNF